MYALASNGIRHGTGTKGTTLLYYIGETISKVINRRSSRSRGYYAFLFAMGSSSIIQKKPDGSLWFFVDYHGLNKLIIKETYPLP